MANNTERIFNLEEAKKMNETLEKIADGITALNKADKDATFSTLAWQTKQGSAEKFNPLGTQFTVNRTSTITVTMDKINVTTKLVTEGSASCTMAISDISVFNSIFGSTGATAIQCYYDGSNWRDYESDEIVVPTDQGASITGTPASGDRATLTRTASSFIMEVADYDHYTPAVSSIEHLTTLVAEDCCINAFQFNTPQLSWACTTAILPAGKYKFTAYQNADDNTGADGVYVFTTTQPIPVGGGWRHSNIGKNFSWGGGSATMITDGTITTYGTDRKTAIESGIVVTAYNASTDTGAVDLGASTSEYVSGYTYVTSYGVMNFSRRSAYGDGSYAVSQIRQWLNSNKIKGSWWSPCGAFDLRPSVADTENGFLYGCDDDFVKNLQTTKVKYYMHDSDYNLMTAQSASKPVSFGTDSSVSVSGRVITCEDKVFLASIVEVGLGNQWNDNLAGNTALALYDGMSNEDRIKYYGSTARDWWLRSGDPWSCNSTAYVDASGALGSYGAINTHGVVAACNIG